MSLPIVGIGASAGGLESFSELLARLPADTGMAYVFVQHLDPGHASRLVEILSKRAGFPVEQAREGAKILPDRLYVIAPNTTLTLGGSVLHLRSRDPAEDRIALLMRSSIRLLKREGPTPLALFSLGAESTEQKVFKRSNRQVESLSRRTRVLLSFMECQTAPSERHA
jgi:two-component system, chemotaxis family, CheB/CheR fusion protein